MCSWRAAVGSSVALALALALALASCEPPARDLFAALEPIPGGALLSAWVAPDGTVAYLAGGFVGIDPPSLPDPASAGRLVRYREGRFETVCRAPSALWWVHVAGGEVFASGERGVVLRYREGVGCERLTLGVRFDRGEPTLWGIAGSSPRNLVFVGGSAAPDGPRGVLLAFDGSAFRAEPVPESAREENLFKVTQAGDAMLVVGSRGTVLRRDAGASAWVSETVPPLGGDGTLFTVSCTQDGTRCLAVGGIGVGRIVHRDAQGRWTRDPLGDDFPGLSGVWTRSDTLAFVVGNQGTALALTPTAPLVAPTPATEHPLHAVHGARDATLVLAVGGAMFDPRPTQSATILLRGVDRGDFTFDGAPLTVRGRVRSGL
jgi:hypothetical protein